MNHHSGGAVLLGLGLLISALTVTVLAQPVSGPGTAAGQKQIIGQGVQHNLASIGKVMREIHQLMFQGTFTPKQDTEVSRMMLRLGIMMQEMSGPQSEKLAKKYEKDLKEIRRQIETIKQQLQERK